jgi:hypothetical protein
MILSSMSDGLLDELPIPKKSATNSCIERTSYSTGAAPGAALEAGRGGENIWI